MSQYSKSILIVTSLLLLTIPITPSTSASDDIGPHLTSPTKDGIWINNTLVINGSTTLPPQSADWVLYDVTNPYVEWPILASGEYFTSVTPVDDGLWIWSLTIDVVGQNCTCWLEVGQTNGLGKEFLNRIIFIGEGPHNPVISPNHETNIIIDGEYTLSSRAVLADSQANDSKLILNWCLAPNGACDGTIHDAEANVSWDDGIGTFTIDANDLGLDDGVWKFTYYLQDTFLRTSPDIEMTVFVDQTDPSSVMISPETAFEGEMIVIDGTGSTDGVWSNNLQSIWYITDPDGVTYVPTSNTTEELLNIALSKSGNYTIRLDVIDWVGRMSSSNATIFVTNVAPIIDLQLEGSSISNPNTWQFMQSDELELVANTIETGDDSESLSYSWYLDGDLVSSSINLTLQGMDVGEYDLLLVVVDNDGAQDTHEIKLSVNEEAKDESGNFNIAAVFMLIGIVAFSFMMFRRMRMTENEASVLPKWDSSSKTKSGDSENDMWIAEESP